jgi:hypothetical protein
MILLKNLKYIDKKKNRIDMDITFEDGITIPFTYDPEDNAPVSKIVRQLLQDNVYVIEPSRRK